MRSFAALCLLGLMLAACSGGKPPVGRWEGLYAGRDALVVARLEVEKDGKVRVSAPDALDVANASDAQRAMLLARLKTDLDAAWGDAAPRAMDFDGHVFRKPGGIAHQIEWDKAANAMTLILYPGTAPIIRVPLHAVSDFPAAG